MIHQILWACVIQSRIFGDISRHLIWNSFKFRTAMEGKWISEELQNDVSSHKLWIIQTQNRRRQDLRLELNFKLSFLPWGSQQSHESKNVQQSQNHKTSEKP